jgi:hypothetical protein
MVPRRNVTRQVVVPAKRILVLLFTPRPKRWKLCERDRSRTTMVYRPGLSRVIRAPLVVRSEIVALGPTVAMSLDPTGGGGGAGGGGGGGGGPPPVVKSPLIVLG